MEIVNVKITNLKPYDKNAKKHPEDQISKIANSIQEFGFNVPIIIDKDYNIIAGHGRLEAARLLGLLEVPTLLKKDLSKSQIKAFRIADNKVAESDWNLDFLKEEFKALKGDNYDLDYAGFDESEVSKLTDSLEVEEDDYNEDIDKFETNIKKQDIFELGNHRLMCGDSTIREDVNRLMNGIKADMILTDVPYGIDFRSNHREKTPKFDKIINDNQILKIDSICYDNTKDNTVSYIFTRWDVYPEWFNQFNIKFNIKNCIVWYKRGGGLGDLKNAYSPFHEFIIVAHKGIKEIIGKRDADVWEIGRDGFNDYKHPTQKPIELMAFPIQKHSMKDELILDLFGGSGSTLIACEQLDRKCFMMELDPKYCQMIINRWEAFTGNKAEKING